MSSEAPAASQFVDFACDHCRDELRAIRAAAGCLARCPACGRITPIPVADEDRTELPGFPPVPGDPTGDQQAADGGVRSPEHRPLPVFSRAFGYVPPAVPSLVSVGDILGRAWDIYFHRFFQVVPVVLVAWLGTGVALAVGLSLDALVFWLVLQIATVEIAILAGFLGLFPALLPAVWIQVGELIYMVKLVRGHRPEWGDLLRGGSCIVDYLHALLSIGLLIFLGVCLCVLPALLVLAVLTPALFLIVERGLRPAPAMKAAWRLARGNFLDLLLVVSVHVGVESVGQLIPCGLGTLLTAPFIAVMWTVTYLRLTGQPTVTYEFVS